MTLAIDSKKSQGAAQWLFVGLTISWLGFITLFVFKTGKWAILNVPASAPTFLFVVAPLLLIVGSALSRVNLSLQSLGLFGLVLGASQLQVNTAALTGSHALAPATESQLKVFNWNPLMWDENKDQNDFYDFLVEQDADVYVFQERLHNVAGGQHLVTPDRYFAPQPITRAVPGFLAEYLVLKTNDDFKNHFRDYYFAADQQFLVLSRYPILGHSLDSSDQFQRVDLDLGERTLRIFNVHMLLHLEFKNPLSQEFYEVLSRRHQARVLGFDNLKKDLNQTQTDYLILGDFNSTSAMGNMKELLNTHHNLFNYSGEILPVTFEFFGLGLWQIDYALLNLSSHFQVADFKNLNLNQFSDHYAQALTLAY